ncbi:protein eva-1 homolog C-like isoform X1 [Saccostrea cucullata]|uniref:protein eva-1 homolog C-like isoform X1 n=1 Tax=Saccostrea cuccullata TaxID=36930 RepID=UPI002ED27CBD
MTPLHWNFYSVFLILCIQLLKNALGNSGLLSSTLETFEATACDGEVMEPYCPPATMISIQFSQYGRQVPSYEMCPSKNDLYQDEWFREDTNCLATTSLRVLFDSCQNRQQCKVTASTYTFRQDPCPKTSKYLKVSYKCNPSDFSNMTVCDGKQMIIRCQKPLKIVISDAIYGRMPQDTSLCSGNIPADCRSSTAVEKVMKKCHGRNRCAMDVEEYVFGNPCPPEIPKYLKVIYTCVPKKILKHNIRHRKNRRKKERTTAASMNNTDINIPKVTTSKPDPNMYPKDQERNKDTDNSNGNQDSKMEGNDTTHCVNYTLAPPEPVAPSTSRKGSATGLVVDWLNTFNFFEKNREKALLYLILGLCVGIIIFLLVIVINLVIINKQKRRATLDVTDPAHSSTQPPPLESNVETPMLPRHDSMDRIEVVRFEPRRTIARASLIDNGDRTLNHYYG